MLHRYKHSLSNSHGHLYNVQIYGASQPRNKHHPDAVFTVIKEFFLFCGKIQSFLLKSQFIDTTVTRGEISSMMMYDKTGAVLSWY